MILLLTHSYLQLILLTVGCLDNIVMPKVKGQKSKGNVVCVCVCVVASIPFWEMWCVVCGVRCWALVAGAGNWSSGDFNSSFFGALCHFVPM